jgi:hypothetical protein
MQKSVQVAIRVLPSTVVLARAIATSTSITPLEWESVPALLAGSPSLILVSAIRRPDVWGLD